MAELDFFKLPLMCLSFCSHHRRNTKNSFFIEFERNFHLCFTIGHVSVLKWLNAKGDISSIDKLGGSPLHDAAEQGQFEVC